MIKAIIFDLFATLTSGECDTEKMIMKVFRLEYDYAYIEKFVCGTHFKDWDSYLNRIVQGLKLPDIEETRSTLLDIFKLDFAKERMNPDMVNIVKILRSKEIKIGILSNIANPEYDIIRKNNLQGLFDVILYSYDKGVVKPEFEFFNLMLSQLNSKSNETIMIGDSLRSDITPAKALGMHTIHFTNAAHLKKALTSFSINLD